MNALLERLTLNAKVERWRRTDDDDERIRRGTHRMGPKPRLILDAVERESHKHSLAATPIEFSVVCRRADRVMVVRDAGHPVAAFRGFDCGMDIAARMADRWIEAAELPEKAQLRMRKHLAVAFDANTETRYLLYCLERLEDPTVQVIAHA
jgi:hypothetical protein